MAKLADVIGVLLRDVVMSRSAADKFSAQISAEYEKDEILRHFPIPRIEIGELTISLKFAISKMDKDARNAEVIVEADKLKEIREETLSAINIVTSMRNYSWMRTDLGSQKYKLVQTE